MKTIGSTIKPCHELSTIALDPAKTQAWAVTRQLIGRITHPSKRLTDPDFNYTRACATDLRETFKRVRQQRAGQ